MNKEKEIKTANDDVLCEVLEGLSQKQKELPSKLFYDEEGSKLFDQICTLDEYYPTRTELKIMQDNIQELSALLGEGTLLVELGSGSSLKIRLLLDNIPGLAGYVPIDISEDYLLDSAGKLKEDYNHIDIFPLAADYTKSISLPEINKPYDHIAVYFPGSTIGNFTKPQAINFLKRIANLCGYNGGLVIGVDLVKDKSILEAAYNDKKGITALFNLNILKRLNNEFGANFNLSRFKHKAIYNEELKRIEMRLYSTIDQTVSVSGYNFVFKKDEFIITEYSHKYSLNDFKELVKGIFEVRKVWTDENNLFSIQYLRHC